MSRTQIRLSEVSVAPSVSANKPALAGEAGNTDKKRTAILEAAMSVFLKSGYLGASMDEIAALAQVSKQTVYKQFSNKESLFVEIVTSMTDTASDTVHNDVPELTESSGISEYLQLYAFRQLTVVLTPPLMQLRRLVIGEVSRFPELARILYERGPQRAIAAFARVLEQLAARDLLTIDEPKTAASHFNWLVMSEPLNRAMLLGDTTIPKQAALRRHAAECVRVFLAAYGRQSTLAASDSRSELSKLAKKPSF
jgi:TetR/AcrR family transcriptional regulator, mexJK operon transcriptional repressor